MLNGLQLVLANIADFLWSTMEWTEKAHIVPANAIAKMGCSTKTLLAQVRATLGTIATAEVLSSTTAQTGAKGRGIGTKLGQHSWAEIAWGVSIDDARATNGSHYTKDL